MDRVLERALREAPERLGLPRSASESERLRAWARLGYQRSLEEEHDRERLETYREWADDPEMGIVAAAAFRRAVELGMLDED